MDVKDVNMEGDVQGLAEALKKVNDSLDLAEGHTQPRGELEARLRKPGAKGTLVEMANGDVAYIPTVEYSAKYYTDERGEAGMTLFITGDFHQELVDLMKLEEQAGSFENLPALHLTRKLHHIIRENYPEFKADELNEWLGPKLPYDQNPHACRVMRVFMGMSKN